MHLIWHQYTTLWNSNNGNGFIFDSHLCPPALHCETAQISGNLCIKGLGKRCFEDACHAVDRLVTSRYTSEDILPLSNTIGKPLTNNSNVVGKGIYMIVLQHSIVLLPPGYKVRHCPFHTAISVSRHKPFPRRFTLASPMISKCSSPSALHF